MGKTVQNLTIGGLTEKQSLVIVFETIKYLGWRIKFTSDAGVIAYTENGGFSWNGEITVKLEQDMANVQCISISNALNDYGHCKNAVQQFIAAFEKLRPIFTDDEILAKYKDYKKDFLPPYEDTLKPDITPRFHLFDGFLSFFKPAEGYFFTPILVSLNILIFIIMVCSGISIFEPKVQSMLLWGANSAVSTLDGQWWRLVSSCFIHFGVIHLLLNMYALVYVGVLLEPFLGKIKFLTAYLLTGIIGSLLSLWWHDNTVSAGASGAIFGLYGVFFALLSTNHVERSMRNGLLTNIGMFVIYNLVYGSFKGGIDNAAHIGGLLSGVLIGYLYMPGLRKPDNKRLNWVISAGIIVVMLGCSAFTCSLLAKSDRLIYHKRMQEFYQLETKAMEGFQEKETNTDLRILAGFKEGIAYWNRGIKLIRELDRLNLSKKAHQKNKVLIEYCLLRIKSYQLLYRAAKRNANADESQLHDINQQIHLAFDKLRSD